MLLLVACAHRGPVLDTGPVGETGDTADTGARDTADADPAASPCGPWSGVARVGTRWTYAPSDAYVAAWGYDGTYTIEVAAIDGALVTLSQSGAYTGASGSFSWTRVDTWRCDADGAWWVRSEAATHGTSGGSDSDTTGWRTFDPGWRVRPAVAEPWQDAFTVTASVNGADPVAIDATCDTAISDASTRTIAGRERTVRQVTPVCTGVGADPAWIAEGIGLVETADEVLVAYEP